MILRAFKNRRPTTIVLLVLAAICLWSFSITDANLHSSLFSTSIYYRVIHFLEGMPFILQLASIVLIIVQAMMVNNLVMNNELIATRTHVPALVYITLMSCTPELLTFHPGLIGNIFIILMLGRLFDTYRTERDFTKIFDAGLFLGLASTVYFPYAWILIFGWISLLILRSFSWRDWVIYAAGATVPYLFIWTYYYAFNDLSNLIPHFTLLASKRAYHDVGIQYSYFPVMIVFVGLLFFSARTVFTEWRIGAIKVKKLLTILLVFSVVSTVFPIFTSGLNITGFTALAIPLCIYLSNHFVNSKRQIVTEASFLLLLISIVYLHIVTL